MTKMDLSLFSRPFQSGGSTELRDLVCNVPAGSAILLLEVIDEMTVSQDWDGEQLALCLFGGARGWAWSRHLASMA